MLRLSRVNAYLEHEGPPRAARLEKNEAALPLAGERRGLGAQPGRHAGDHLGLECLPGHVGCVALLGRGRTGGRGRSSGAHEKKRKAEGTLK